MTGVVSQTVSAKHAELLSINLDIEALKARVDEVLSSDLYWFPVRHHSPSVALNLRKVLLKRKPKVIFIEGPSQANELIPFLTEAKTKPPVAIYTSFRDDANLLGWAGIASATEDLPPVFPCWYPMLDYSPEYVAIKVAAEIGAKVLFIDLPHYARIKPMVKPDETQMETPSAPSPPASTVPSPPASTRPSVPASTRPSVPASTPPSPGASPTDSPDASTPVEEIEPVPSALLHDDEEAVEERLRRELAEGSEHLIVESRFYQKLAKSAGYRTYEEAWDSLFEMRDFDDPEVFRREIASFCAASRATTIPLRMILDSTIDRERHMMRSIRRGLEELNFKESEAMVVCGGFHLFLDQNDKNDPPTPPEGTIYNTIVPYSFYQVSELSGYAAGTRAPQFYQRVWGLSQLNRSSDIVVEHVVSVLNECRKKGNILSSADAIAVAQHTLMLSRLRGRSQPVLDDIHDALVTCCVKGDPAEEGGTLFAAIDAADIGHSIGKVTPNLGQLPVVADFHSSISDLDLGEALGKEKRLTIETDKREPQGERRSVFLHRLKFLEVPFCNLAEAPSGDFSSGKLFREKWHLKWSPAVDSALIELNLFGDSIERAALARLKKLLLEDEHSAGKISHHLLRAVDMDLPDLIRTTEDALSEAIDNDARFVSLVQALSTMFVLEKYLVYRSLRRGMLDDLIIRCYDRACFAILDVVSVPEQQQDEVVAYLVALAEATQQGDKQGLDRNLFAEHVREAADTSPVPFLKGAFLGILSELRELDPRDLAGFVRALAKSPVETMVTAGDFLDGVMAVSRTSIMIGADSLIQAIDELLRAAEWDPFLVMLPRMRAAFERMHESHRDSLASRVSELYGLKESTSLSELRISADAAVTVARIDRQVASIMKEWEL